MKKRKNTSLYEKIIGLNFALAKMSSAESLVDTATQGERLNSRLQRPVPVFLMMGVAALDFRLWKLQ